MCYPLFKRNMKLMIKPFVALFAVFVMYYGIIIYMYDPEMISMLEQYQEMMPEMMSAMGMTGATDTLLKFINTYLSGSVMILLPLIFIVLMGNNLLVKYSDSGSLANLLASSYSRRRIIVTQAVSMMLSTVLLSVSVSVMGYGFAQAMFPGELDLAPYVKLNFYSMLLQIAISSICFCSACLFQESRYYYMAGCGLPLLSYLFHMLGNMSDTFGWMKKISVYSLFPSERIVEGGKSTVAYLLTLIVIIIALYGVGCLRFTRKDLFL